MTRKHTIFPGNKIATRHSIPTTPFERTYTERRRLTQLWCKIPLPDSPMIVQAIPGIVCKPKRWRCSSSFLCRHGISGTMDCSGLACPFFVPFYVSARARRDDTTTVLRAIVSFPPFFFSGARDSWLQGCPCYSWSTSKIVFLAG